MKFCKITKHVKLLDLLRCKILRNGRFLSQNIEIRFASSFTKVEEKRPSHKTKVHSKESKNICGNLSKIETNPTNTCKDDNQFLKQDWLHKKTEDGKSFNLFTRGLYTHVCVLQSTQFMHLKHI
jgi:hypothetical protein